MILPVAPTSASRANEAAFRTFARTFEQLDTRRFSLRLLAPSDADAIYAACQNPRVNKGLGSFPQPFDRAAAAEWLEGRFLRIRDGIATYCGIYEHDAPTLLIGFVGAYWFAAYQCVELSWALSEKRWGQFVVDEVGEALVSAMVAAGVTQVCATAAVDNAGSIRVIKRLGLVQTGEVDFIRPDGTARPSYFFSRDIL